MMRRLYAIIAAIAVLTGLMAACTKTVLQTARQPAYYPDTGEATLQSPDERRKLALQTALPVIEEPVFNLPEYIIDDFEHGLKKWKVLTSSAIKAEIDEMYSIQTNNTVVRVTYVMPSQRQIRLNPDSLMVKVRKDARFEKYKGIRFMARATPSINLSVILIETNQVRKDIVATELWCKKVLLTSSWQQFRVDFKQLKHEEYYEQNYMGDDIQDLTSIKQVGFRIDNAVPLESKTGSFFLDDIYIY
jgi:hypothetical protein